MLEALRVEVWHDEATDWWSYRCPEMPDVPVLGSAKTCSDAHAAALQNVRMWVGAEGRAIELVNV